MAGEHNKLQDLIKLLAAGKGTRDETIAVLTDAAERLAALEISNKRLREEMRSPAQAAWTEFMASAIRGYLAHEDVAFEFSESQWIGVMNNCEEHAENALERWKLRWVDGVVPKRTKRGAAADVDPISRLPKPAEIASPEETHGYVQAIHDMWGPAPRPVVQPMEPNSSPPRGPAMQSAPAVKPPPSPVTAPAEAQHAATTAPPTMEEPPATPARRPAAPARTPTERQPGDD